MQLLIDGDLCLYRSAASSEFECDWGDDTWVLSTNLTQAKDSFKSQIDKYISDIGSKDIVIILSGSKNYRYDLDPTYKSNRKGVRKPLGFKALKDWLYEEYGPERVKANDMLEADDYMGILATDPQRGKGRCIVSEDKDMQTIPCSLWRNGEMLEITEAQADRYWMLQTLTGDSADGYKGCPGIGAVKAEAILSKPGSMWENVRQAFLKAGTDEEHAVLQARLARILRFGDWDSERKQVRLWTPSQTSPR
ncbi:hypothetical protein BSL82_03475 [Tardibacter chloracetimidivorans]|uniref:5'-3' exonuclease domain-containing protein n=1 Tax=Tardibacter chloracetimidivorans TaxID=1921510 RepID=A0A1L3ZS76_9SPHN|nr:hypothetical protein [Tardibacter chloracetimidivorans]API58478.1 hypothetical protein BSL82_03475 [Tardibacter chloracetimidivorans]